jgi:hypothetical protein
MNPRTHRIDRAKSPISPSIGRPALHLEITRHSLIAQPLHTSIPDDLAMDISSALNKFSLFGSSHHHEHDLHDEDRVRISRSRRAIELQDQELMQLALLQERQHSA